MVFVAYDESSEVEEPRDGSLDDPAMAVASQASPVLSRGLLSAPTMRTDQLHIAVRKSVTQPVGIGGTVVDHPGCHACADTCIDESFDRVDFRLVGGKCEGRQRNTVAIDHHHNLAAFASLGQADIKAPFFAGENVPSPIASDQCSNFRRSSRRRSLRHASSQTPDSVHSRWRRWQVEGLGYRSGKSCHRAPFFSTQMIPSRQSRGFTRGLPPLGDGGGFRNRSRMIAHWASVINGFGAVLDPVVFGRRRGGHSDREIVIAFVSCQYETNANTLPIKHHSQF